MCGKSNSENTDASAGEFRWTHHIVFCAVCALVIGIFVWSAQPGYLEVARPNAVDAYYNLLVQGFRAGQLSVNREAPPGLDQLADPYDPASNTPYVWEVSHLSYELSYYKGKLYLYFGVTPALVLFWPYVALTGHYLSHKYAVLIFYSLGFLIAAGLGRAVWRRYFPEVGFWVVAMGILTLGLATGILEDLSRCDVHEVAVSCEYAFTMLVLAAIWRALRNSKWQIMWLLLASLAYGLAIGSRPLLLFGVIILLLPVVRAWRAMAEQGSRRRVALLLMAAVGPVMFIGLGLMIYNTLRFGSPFEFGLHYHLTNYRNNTAQLFSLHYLWVNFRFYFLEPVQWSGHFPFLQAISLSSLPSGYYGFGLPNSGILSNSPVTWLALAAPLAWRGRTEGAVSILRWFVATVFLLFAICALTLCLYYSGSSSYEVDFLPALMLLAVIGILGLERALVGLPLWRRIARCGWCLLLAYTIVFNMSASVEAHATANYLIGNSLLHQGRVDEAVECFQKALALQPESASFHNGLGNAFYQKRRMDEAIVQYQKALAIQPESVEACEFLGEVLFQTGQIDQAIVQYQKALEIKPNFAEAHNNLGSSFLRIERVNEAIVHFQKAIEIKPDFAEAHNNLGSCLLQIGRVDEAIIHYRKAIELQPHLVHAYNDLAYAFIQKRMATEAIAYYQKAIELQPQFVAAQINLAWILATWPEPAVRNGNEAVTLAEQANRFSKGEDPQILRVLAAAYAETGRFHDAVAMAQRALALALIQPQSGLTNALQKEVELYQNNTPCR